MEAQLHKDIRKQARKDKTQWLKDRLAESEATLDPRQKWKWIKRVRSDYKPRPVSIRDSQGKPTSPSQQAQTFAEYLRDSHWAAPPTPYTGPTDPIHPAAAVDLTPITAAELKAALRACTQQSTGTRYRPRRSLAVARRAQPIGCLTSPQPSPSHSHYQQ